MTWTTTLNGCIARVQIKLKSLHSATGDRNRRRGWDASWLIYLFIYFSWHSVTLCTSKIPRDCSRLIKNISISVQQEAKITHFVCVCVCVPSGCILLENTERRMSPSPLSWLDWTVNTMNTESKTLAAGSPRMDIFFFMFCSIVIFLGKTKFFLQGKNSCGIAWVTFIHFFLLNIVISVNLSCFALWVGYVLKPRD